MAAYIDYLTTYATKFVPSNPGPPYYGSGYIQVVGNNECGSSVPVQCGYGPCGGFMAAPNPADNYIDIIINEEFISAESLNPGSEYILTMVDKMGEVKYTAEVREFPYRINTSYLEEGLYIINLIYDSEIISMQVIIEH